MLRLSVIIPVVRTLPKLEDTLVAVLEYKPDDCEVIVVLDEPYPDPYDLAGEVIFLQAGNDTTLGRAINLGLEIATGSVVHILTCGNLPQKDWAEAALPHFDDGRIAAVIPLAIDPMHTDQVVAAGMGYDSAGRLVYLQRGITLGATVLCHRTQVLPHFSGAIFCRSRLRQVQGADETLNDRWVLADLTLRLLRCGGTSILEPNCKVASDPTAEPTELGYAAARDAERFFWRWHDRRGITLARHLALLTQETFAALPKGQVWPCLTGRIAGLTGSAEHAQNNGRAAAALMNVQRDLNQRNQRKILSRAG